MGILFFLYNWCKSYNDKEIKISDEKHCIICLEECISYLKPCGHKYHYKCIKTWFNQGKKQKKCPYCQKNVYSIQTFNGQNIFL